MNNNNFTSKRKNKFLLYCLIVIITIFVIGICILWVANNYEVKNTEIYTLNVGSISDLDQKQELYIEEGEIGQRIEYGTSDYREISSSSPLNVVFKPQLYLGNNKNATIELEFIKIESDVYLNEKLILPKLENYDIIKDFDNMYLYKKKNISSIQDYKNVSINNFISQNYYGSTIYSVTSTYEKPNFINDYKNKNSLINSYFRDDLRFLIYTEGDTLISFFKKDLNVYNGADEYTLLAKDIQGNVVFTKVYGDDGNTGSNGTIWEEKKYDVKINNLQGIYSIEFIKDKNNQYSDSSIGNISFNTNKVIIDGNFLVLTPFHFYINNNFDQNISFRYWHKNKEQEVKIFSNNIPTTIRLNESYRDIDYKYYLAPGEHEVIIDKGYLWTFNKFKVSPIKENWFEVPFIVQDKLEDPDFILIDHQKIRPNKRTVTVIENVTIDSPIKKFKISTTDNTKLKLNSVKLIFK